MTTASAFEYIPVSMRWIVEALSFTGQVISHLSGSVVRKGRREAKLTERRSEDDGA